MSDKTVSDAEIVQFKLSHDLTPECHFSMIRPLIDTDESVDAIIAWLFSVIQRGLDIVRDHNKTINPKALDSGAYLAALIPNIPNSKAAKAYKIVEDRLPDLSDETLLIRVKDQINDSTVDLKLRDDIILVATSVVVKGVVDISNDQDKERSAILTDLCRYFLSN